MVGGTTEETFCSFSPGIARLEGFLAESHLLYRYSAPLFVLDCLQPRFTVPVSHR